MKCAYKKAQQQIKEEAFQDGDFLQKVHQYLSSPDVLENTTLVRLQVIIYKLKLLGDHNWLMIVGNFSLILLYDDNLVAIMYKCVNNNTL